MQSQMTTDKIHQLSQELYKTLSKSTPLPALPLTDPKWVCHTLLERLQLPQCFYTMLDNALTGVYWPECRKCVDHFKDTSCWKEKRLDVECMAFLVCIIKMIYRLDDVYELWVDHVDHVNNICLYFIIFCLCSEQSSEVCSADESAGGDTSGDYVYMWQDWVTVFCRHMQQTLDKGTPLNARYNDCMRGFT